MIEVDHWQRRGNGNPCLRTVPPVSRKISIDVFENDQYLCNELRPGGLKRFEREMFGLYRVNVQYRGSLIGGSGTTGPQRESQAVRG